MLNRNAARHLLLVVSILLCAFIYAGYTLATRGGAEPAEEAAGTAEGGVTGLRPAAASGDDGDSAVLLIPPANGDELSLTPPVAQTARTLPPPPEALSSDEDAISGLVPADFSGDAEDSDASGIMPGANLPLPGFSSEATEGGGAALSSPPVLTLPGMAGAAGSEEDFGDGDFGDADFGDVLFEEEDGDFAALPGFGPIPETAAAPVLAPPPGAVVAPPPAAAPVAAAPASSPVVPAGVPPRPASEVVLRPPPQSAPPPRAAADAAAGAPPAAPAVRPVVAPPAPAPQRTTPPPPPPAGAPGGMAGGDVPEPRSDSLRVYVVAPGDTLSSIAMRELGSGFLADNIFLLNRDVIDDPNRLLAGVKIRLPYANPAAGADAEPAPGGAPGRRPTQGLGSTHTVARGDTLSSIAERYYGQSSAWRFLHEANKAIVPNPDQLTVGTELSVPPYGGNL